MLYQSEPVNRTEAYNIGSITLRAASTGEDGTAIFDDVEVEEYRDGIVTLLGRTVLYVIQFIKAAL